MIAMSQNAFSMENLHEAYIKARKGKRGSVNTRGFEVNLYAELQYLSFSLRNGSYSPSRSVCFYVQKPKLREIFAANFRDRVVHRLLVDILEPEFEKTFIYDSWANRSGKGTHSAVGRLKEFVKRGTSDGSLPFYYLQLDIKGYFMSLDKKILMRLLERKVQSKELLHLSRTIVMHDPTQNFVFKGKIPPAGILPPHKTLFHDNPGKGIPIVRRRVVKNFFAAMHESLPPKPQENGAFLRTQYLPEWKNWQTAQSRINSYLAHTKFANSKHLEKKVAQILQPFSGMVTMEDGYVRLFRPHRFPYFHTQVAFYRGKYPEDLLIMQLGNYTLFLGKDVERLSECVGIPLEIWDRKIQYFKIRFKNQYMVQKIKKCIKKYAISYVVIRETGEISDRIKLRIPVRRVKRIHAVQLALF